jgi:hypothetical protein
MTTKVTIVNFGPDYVLVRSFRKDNEPGDPSWVGCGQAAAFIPPGGNLTWLILDEDKKGQFAPPDPGPNP